MRQLNNPHDTKEIERIIQSDARLYFCETDGCPNYGHRGELVELESGEFHCPTHAEDGAAVVPVNNSGDVPNNDRNKFTLTIDTSNAAFAGDFLDDYGDFLNDYAAARARRDELARILRKLADTVADGHNAGTLADINGNTVGSWSLV